MKTMSLLLIFLHVWLISAMGNGVSGNTVPTVEELQNEYPDAQIIVMSVEEFQKLKPHLQGNIAVLYEHTSSRNPMYAMVNTENNTVVIGYSNGQNANRGEAVVFKNSSTNSADFIGITKEAIADTATGLVTPQGGVNTSVSSLTTGSDYYVQNDGTLSTTVSSVPAGRALSTTSILLEG